MPLENPGGTKAPGGISASPWGAWPPGPSGAAHEFASWDVCVLFNADSVVLRGFSRKDVGDFLNEINEVSLQLLWEWGARSIKS